jgi:rhomboid protease GluP
MQYPATGCEARINRPSGSVLLPHFSGIIGAASNLSQGLSLELPSGWKRRLSRLQEKTNSLFQSEPKQARPRLCPACGTLVGATSTRCFQCGANVNYSLAAASKTLERLMPAASPATYGILFFTVLMFAATLLATVRESGAGALGSTLGLGGISGPILARFGASAPLPFNLREPWRFVMAIFLHGGLLHIGMNMWVLMDIAPQIEELYGSARFFFLYVATGIAGFVLSSATNHFSVGASASLLGLIGVMLSLTTRRGGYGMQMLRKQLIMWLVYIAVLGLIIRGVDNWAHAGGLAAGFLLGRVMADRTPSTPGEVRLANALGWGTGLVVALSFVAMILANFRGGS